NPLEFL
nr:Chain H, ASN-PRO-LEU-GLU-PHE-LEU [Homo sapiens]6XQI_I Chain I, ASN-PRO-LEU-GLU-PHE-LEU [Homo sapiens]